MHFSEVLLLMAMLNSDSRLRKHKLHRSHTHNSALSNKHRPGREMGQWAAEVAESESQARKCTKRCQRCMVSDPCRRILKEFPTWSQIEFSGEIHKRNHTISFLNQWCYSKWPWKTLPFSAIWASFLWCGKFIHATLNICWAGETVASWPAIEDTNCYQIWYVLSNLAQGVGWSSFDRSFIDILKKECCVALSAKRIQHSTSVSKSFIIHDASATSISVSGCLKRNNG